MNATKTEKAAYWISTAFVILLMLWAVYIYHATHDHVVALFEAFSYPTYLIYPLAYLKLVGAIVIITNRYSDLKEWVYASYFMNMILALVAHLVAGDFYLHAVVGGICMVVSYLLSNRVRGRPQKRLINIG